MPMQMAFAAPPQSFERAAVSGPMMMSSTSLCGYGQAQMAFAPLPVATVAELAPASAPLVMASAPTAPMMMMSTSMYTPAPAPFSALPVSLPPAAPPVPTSVGLSALCEVALAQ